MSTNERVIEQVRALLSRTSENGCTDAEVEEAARAVERLLTKHDLELGDLSGGPSKGSGIDSIWLSVSDRLDPGWYAHLCITTAHLCYCELFVNEDDPHGLTDGLHLVGMPTDLAVARELLAFFVDQAEQRFMASGTRRTEHGLQSFLDGYGEALARRLVRLRREREGLSTGSADLAVYRTELIRIYMNPTLGDQVFKVNVAATGDQGAYKVGAKHGNEVPLQPTKPIDEPTNSNRRRSWFRKWRK